MTIPHSRPYHCPDDEAALVEAYRSGMTAAGPRAAALAETIRAAYGGVYAATAASGTLALVMALHAAGCGPGDDVLLPTYVCGEVADAIRFVGARPVLCDVDEATFSLSPATVAAARTGRTKAVLLPHLFGVPADAAGVMALGLLVIEDLAQGLGATVEAQRPAGGIGEKEGESLGESNSEGDRHPAGRIGHAAVFSFKAIKMASGGEGGAVSIRDPGMAARLRAAHERDDPQAAGFHFPLSDLLAALVGVQWARLESFVAERRRLAARYADLLAPARERGIVLPADAPGRAWFRYPLRLPDDLEFDVLRAAMDARGVQVRRPVDALLHRQWGLDPAAFPAAERLFRSVLSLPLYPALTDAAQERVAHAFLDVLRGQGAAGSRQRAAGSGLGSPSHHGGTEGTENPEGQTGRRETWRSGDRETRDPESATGNREPRTGNSELKAGGEGA